MKMKSMMVFWVILVILSGVGGKSVQSASESRTEDAQQIQALVNNLVQAYNTKDEAALEKLWAEEGDLASVPGSPASKGKQAILQELQRGRETHYKDGELKLSITGIKFVGKNAAFVEARNMLTGVITPGGTKLPPIAHHMIFLMEKEKNGWLINVARWYSAVPIVRQRS